MLRSTSDQDTSARESPTSSDRHLGFLSSSCMMLGIMLYRKGPPISSDLSQIPKFKTSHDPTSPRWDFHPVFPSRSVWSATFRSDLLNFDPLFPPLVRFTRTLHVTFFSQVPINALCTKCEKTKEKQIIKHVYLVILL
jgi:hypothetical protein